MEVLVSAQTYNTYGASDLFSPAGDLLTLRLGDYGGAVTAVDVTAYLPSPTRNPTRTLEELFDQYHRYLTRLPRITYRRRLQRVEIGFLSGRFHAADNQRRSPPPQELRGAAAEVAEALLLIRKRIKPADDFDVERFLADAATALNAEIGDPDEWEAIRQAARDKRAALAAAKDPWERLEIDWTQYHPLARRILDDVFFWSATDDYSPHGNDTGADLLADFRRWQRRHAAESPLAFLDGLLRDWDVAPIDWMQTAPTAVGRLDRDAWANLVVCNELAIALAFAVLKLRGECPGDVRDMALAALTRTEALVIGDPAASEWAAAVAKMRARLIR